MTRDELLAWLEELKRQACAAHEADPFGKKYFEIQKQIDAVLRKVSQAKAC